MNNSGPRRSPRNLTDREKTKQVHDSFNEMAQELKESRQRVNVLEGHVRELEKELGMFQAKQNLYDVAVKDPDFISLSKKKIAENNSKFSALEGEIFAYKKANKNLQEAFEIN